MYMYKQRGSDAVTFNKLESDRQSLSARQQYTVPPLALCIIPAEPSTVPRITATNISSMGPTYPRILNYRSCNMQM